MNWIDRVMELPVLEHHGREVWWDLSHAQAVWVVVAARSDYLKDWNCEGEKQAAEISLANWRLQEIYRSGPKMVIKSKPVQDLASWLSFLVSFDKPDQGQRKLCQTSGLKYHGLNERDSLNEWPLDSPCPAVHSLPLPLPQHLLLLLSKVACSRVSQNLYLGSNCKEG